MNNYFIIIAFFAFTAYTTILFLDTINHICPSIQSENKSYLDKKNIYDEIIESFPLYYSSMFYGGGNQKSTMEEYDRFFQLNPKYYKYKITNDKNNDNNSLDKLMFSKLITDTLCSKYIKEKDKEIITMDNDQLAKWLIEKNTIILSRYSSTRPSDLDIWSRTLRDINNIRPEAVSVLKRNFFMSREKIEQ